MNKKTIRKRLMAWALSLCMAAGCVSAPASATVRHTGQLIGSLQTGQLLSAPSTLGSGSGAASTESGTGATDSTAGTAYGQNTGTCSCGGTYINGFCSDGDCTALYQAPEGEGTEESPYLIGNAGNLYWFAAQVNSGETSISGKLTADITVNSDVLNKDGTLNGDGSNFRVWIPIGNSYSEYFSGTFDGNGKYISGLYVNSTGNYIGLFGYVNKKGNVKNVIVKDSYLKGESYVGGVVGHNSGGSITGCSNYGIISGNEYYTGGVVGENSGGSITGCSNYGIISGNKYYTGGVVGQNYMGFITDCSNFGAVRGCYYVGGISGRHESGMLTKCYNAGAVRGCYYVGGVLGYGSNDFGNDNTGKVTNCYNTGSVSGIEDTAVCMGGVVGGNCYGSKVTNCYNTGNIGEGGAAVVSYNSDSTVTNCYYLDTCGVSGLGTSATAEQFASGEITYLLNDDQTEIVFKQTLGTDETPNFTGEPVYYSYINCKDQGYTNTNAQEPFHVYVGGFCTGCGAYEPATLNEGGYYEIDNAGKLLWFAAQVNSGNTGINGKLTADIDLENRAWTPIGTKDKPYTGTFDGNGKSISNLSFDDLTASYVGLFGYIKAPAVIRNVSLKNSSIRAKEWVGGIVGYAYASGGNITIENCTNEAEIYSEYVSNGATVFSYAGGIVGYVSAVSSCNITIQNCTNNAKISGIGSYMGGVVGHIFVQSADAKVSLMNCTNSGSEVSDAKGYCVGGVIASASASYGNIILKNCKNSAAVTGSYYVGGLAGSITAYNGGTIEVSDCSNSGSITSSATSSSCVAGIIGKAEVFNYGGNITIANCANSGTVQASSAYAGGIVGNTQVYGQYENDVATLKIYGCNNSGSIISSSNYTGGIIGFAYTRTGGANVACTLEITQCFNTGAITGAVYVGGIAGSSNMAGSSASTSNIKISTCYNTGNVTSTSTSSNSSRAGGIVGFGYMYINNNTDVMTLTTELSNCYNTGAVTGVGTDVGAIYGDTYYSVTKSGTNYTAKFETSNNYYLTGCATDGKDTVQFGAGSSSSGSTTADGDGKYKGMSAEQFSSGEVAYLLNGSTNAGTYKQTLGTDNSPNFTGKDVYYGYRTCADEQKCYANSAVSSTLISHAYGEEGICTSTEGQIHYQPAELKNGYYEISNAGQLFWFANYVNSGNAGANAKLMADIDLGNRLWTPIGLYSDDPAITKVRSNTAFTGTFDGNDHVIKNLYVEMTDNYEAGLFSRVATGGVLKNFGVVNATVKQNQDGHEDKGVRAGIIAGEIYRATVENVFTAGTLVLETRHDQFGGLAGECKESTLKSCYTTMDRLTDGTTGNTPTSVANCYYMADSENASSAGTNMTEAQFASGEVAYKLNGNTNAGTYKQTIGTDSYPNFSGKDVYYGYALCAQTQSYSNDQRYDQITHDFDEKGFCTLCDAYQPCTGSGTESSPYLIGNAGQLYWFAEKVNGGSTGIHGKLTANITINSNVLVDGALNSDTSDFRSWTPIGSSQYIKYVGTFDGGNYVISGLYINSKIDYAGLFGYVESSGVVKNVAVQDSYIACKGGTYIGGVVGRNSGEITNCSNSGMVSGKQDIGGVAGYNNGTITNCSNSGTVSATSGQIGGVVGRNYGAGTIKNCYNTGIVNGEWNGTGGVTGWNYEAKVINCYNVGMVNGAERDKTIGGIIGYNYYGTVTNCYYLIGSAKDGEGTVQNGVGGTDDVAGQTVGKTKERFTSGEVAYLLNGSSSTGIWKQTLDGTTLPGFTGGTVYPATNSGCTQAGAQFSNTQNDTVYGAHTFNDNGFCVNCDSYQPCEKDSDGYYLIGNAGQLYWFAAKVNSGDNSINGKLTADIVVNPGTFDESGNYTAINGETLRNWTPIGNNDNPYIGTFDGQNFIISGLYFSDTSKGYVGLFGYVGENGEVKNVAVNDSYISGYNYVGGVVGYNKGTVTNCYNTGTVTGENYVGGVVGYNKGTVTNCYNTGTVSGENYVGGVVGYNTDTVTNCYNIGTVSGQSDVGGIVGSVFSMEYEKIVSNCYNTGTIEGKTGVGGVVGEIYRGIITNCYNTGKVTGSGDAVGGITGYNSSAEITNCFNTGTIEGYAGVGGIAGGNYNGTNTNCYYLTGCAIDGDETVQFGVGNDNKGETTADVAGQTDAKTTDQFRSGEVTWLLNGKRSQGTTEDPLVWFQTIGTDDSPRFTGKEVYYGYAPCAETMSYANTELYAQITHDFDEKGFCVHCDAYEPCTGSGTESSPYLIGNAGNLYWFAQQVNGGSTGIHGKLTANITLNPGTFNESGDYTAVDGENLRIWTPIGTNDKPYTGTFDGDGHSISGLYFNDTNEGYVGLFRYVQNATLKAITLKNAYVKGQINVGGIVGLARARDGGELTIENCHIGQGSFVIANGMGGGIAGQVTVSSIGDGNRATIRNCSNGAMIAGEGNFGGVIGKAELFGDSLVIEQCVNTADLTGQYRVGGVVGITNGTLEIKNCYNLGDITVTDANNGSAGGIVASSTDATISNCYNMGTISGKRLVGGVIGLNYDGTVTNCYNTGAVSGNTYVGGVVGYNDGNDGTVTNCYYLAGTADKAVGDGDSTDTFEMTVADLTSGKVTWLLNGGKSDGVWKQTLDGTSYPSFTGQTVYKKTPTVCPMDGTLYFTNTEGETFVGTHVFGEDGFCTGCGAYQPCEGEGTAEEPYLIANAGNLYWFAAKVNGGDNSINGKLTADITVNPGKFDADGNYTVDGTAATPRAWTPMGDYENKYIGTFDGTKYDERGENSIGNYAISGLYFNCVENSGIGLFGWVGENGTVKNITVKDSYFKGYQYVGGVVGGNAGTITHCSVSNVAVSGSYHVGGMVGRNDNMVTHCSVSNVAVSGSYHVGGVVGYNNKTVANCSVSSGMVTGTNGVGGAAGTSKGEITHCSVSNVAVSGLSNVGGVVGTNDSELTNCSASSGTVTGTYSVGGVAGTNAGTLTNCYNTAAVSGIDSTEISNGFVGGVVGANYNTITNCYYLIGCAKDSTGTEQNGLGDGTKGQTRDDDAGVTTGKTEAQFASGEVTYLLNGKSSAEDVVWKQTIGTDSFPGFSGQTVYKLTNTGCPAEPDKFSNNASETYSPACDYDDDGFCKNCDGYQPCQGEGTEESPYQISNAGNLYWFAAEVKSGKTSIWGVLTKDITVNQNVLVDGALNSDTSNFRTWTPAGNAQKPYSGTFDGKNHKISGLYFNNSGTDYVGLFSYIETGATVKNVGVVDSYFVGQSSVGGLAGRAEIETGSITIENCYSNAVVSGYQYAGGLIGWVYADGGTITVRNSYTGGAIGGEEHYIGGMFGYCYIINGEMIVKNCYNAATASGESWIGGLIGYAYVSKDNGKITVRNCYNTGDVSGYSLIGGLIGIAAQKDSATFTIENCYNIGKVAGTDSRVGGIVGKNNGSTITNCYYLIGSATDGNGITQFGIGNVTLGEITADEAGQTEGKTSDQFKSGEVTWLLNGERSQGTTEDPLVWYQTIGTDDSPRFSGGTVYRKEGQSGEADTYTNTSPDVVNVTITWTSMEFTYTDGTWQPESHTYGDGSWSTTGGTVTVQNNGNVAITATFAYVPNEGYADITGSFDDKSTRTIAAGESDSATLKLTGKPNGALTGEQLGNILVTIAKAST